MTSPNKQTTVIKKKSKQPKKGGAKNTPTNIDSNDSTAKSTKAASTMQQSEQVIKTPDNRYIDLYDYAPVGYLTLDDKACIQELNFTVAEMLGSDRASLTGTPFSVYLEQGDKDRFFNFLQDISNGQKNSIELTLHDVQQNTMNVRLDTIQICDDKTAVCAYFVAVIDTTEETRVKKELKEKDGEFRLITDNLPIVIAYVDNQQHYRYNNKTYEKWFGYTPEAAYGRHVKDMFGEAIYKKVENYIKTVLSGKKVSYEVDIPDGKKGKRYLHVTYAPHHNELGEVLGFFVVGSDITNRIEAEEELRKERDFAEGLITTAQMIVVVLDPQGRIVSINPYLEKLSGYRQHEVVGKDWFSTFLCANDQSKIHELFSEAITGTKTSGNINPILTRDGEQRFIEWNDTTLTDKQGKTTGLLAIGQDITWHIRLQQSLQESEARYRLLADNSTDMISRQNSNSEYIYVSPSSYLLLGYTPEELTGESFYKYVYPDDLNIARQKFDMALKQGESVLSTLRVLHKNGHYIWVEINSTPVLKKDSEMMNEIISVMRNITEQKETELRERKYLLEHAHESRVRSMGEMTTEIAHELNQPLSAISIYSDAAINLLPEKSAENKDLVKAIQEIKKQADRAGEIIHRLRELVSKKGIHYSTININELINGLIRLIEVETRWHKCKLQLDLAESLPTINADHVLIEQALLNIVRNAIEAMEGINEEQRVLTINSILNNSNEIELEISDTGPGMSGKQIKKAFESFYTTKPSGMGMGLSITQTIVKSHGGRIWAIPNENGGTTFVLTIPINNQGVGV